MVNCDFNKYWKALEINILRINTIDKKFWSNKGLALFFVLFKDKSWLFRDLWILHFADLWNLFSLKPNQYVDGHSCYNSWYSHMLWNHHNHNGIAHRRTQTSWDGFIDIESVWYCEKKIDLSIKKHLSSLIMIKKICYFVS